MKLLFFPLIVLLLLSSLSCNTTEPFDDIKPGRRDYVWKVDTIYSFDPIIRLWGNSPSDLWSVTWGGNFYESFFHYDGSKWSTDGVFRFISPFSIWGFARDNIYVGGMAGKIWHFDGNQWYESAVLSKDGHNDVGFNHLWGESPNDFFASGAYNDGKAGNATVIAHFIDNKWTMLNTNGLSGTVSKLFKDKTSRKIYLCTLQWNVGESFDSIFVYEYSVLGHEKIYSGTWDYDKAASISLINDEVFFVLGKNIAKRINNQFKIILNVDELNFYNEIWGRNSKDIFLKMTDGLAHYNGIDIEYLFHYRERTQIGGAALFKDDVVFLLYESQTGLSLFYHGKLKE